MFMRGVVHHSQPCEWHTLQPRRCSQPPPPCRIRVYTLLYLGISMLLPVLLFSLENSSSVIATPVVSILSN